MNTVIERDADVIQRNQVSPSGSAQPKTDPEKEGSFSNPSPSLGDDVQDETDGPLGSVYHLPGKQRERLFLSRTPSPQEIYNYLDRFVIGNHGLKKTLAVLGYNHMKRLGLQLGLDSARKAFEFSFSFTAKVPPEKQNSFITAICSCFRKHSLNPQNDLLKQELKRIFVFALRKEGTGGRGVIRVHNEARHRIKKNRRARTEKHHFYPTSMPDAILDILVKNTIEQAIKNKKEKASQLTEVSKDNALILGESGSGKTMSIRLLAEYLGVPFGYGSAPEFTRTGYTGREASEIPEILLKSAGNDPALASFGIFFLDELDKVASGAAHLQDDVSGAGAQSCLLQYIEGFFDEKTGVDLRNVLFLGAGAFEGLETIIKKRTGANSIGYDSSAVTTSSSILQQVTKVDLAKFGMMRELLGRFQRLTSTDPVTVETLERMLTEGGKSPFRHRSLFLQEEGIQVVITEDGRKAIAKRAFQSGVGGRSLPEILAKVFEDLEFRAPELKKTGEVIKIDREFVEKACQPESP